MVDELVVATGDNDGDDSSNGQTTSESQVGKYSWTPSSIAPVGPSLSAQGKSRPTIDSLRAQLSGAQEAVQGAKSEEELTEALNNLLGVQAAVLAQLKDYINAAWPSCDINRKINNHNKEHHGGQASSSSGSGCEHPSHRLIAELKRSLDAKGAKRLEELLNTENLTEAQSKELAKLVAQALSTADLEKTAVIASAWANLFGEEDERRKLLYSNYLNPLERISKEVNKTLIALRARGIPSNLVIQSEDVSPPRSLLSRVQKSSDYPYKVREDKPFHLKFSTISEGNYSGEWFVAGEPLTGLSRAVFLAAEWEKKVEEQSLSRALNTEIRQHYYQRFLAQSKEERDSITREIRDLQDQLNKLCSANGWPPVSIAHFSFEA